MRRECAAEVIVATDDALVRAAVESFGGRVVMTRADHPSGTDRVAEVAESLTADVVVNLQGDEPQIDPMAIDVLVKQLEAAPGLARWPRSRCRSATGSRTRARTW